MNLSKKYCWFILSVLLLAACNPAPIEVLLPEQEPKLAISSQVIPGDFMLVTVTRSFSALKGEEQQDDSSTNFLQSVLVNRARVVISHNGQNDTLFRISPGVYMSTIVLLPTNTTIRLNVYDSTSGQSISAESNMMEKVPLTTAFINYKVTGLDTAFFLNYSFTDPAVSNWYLTSVLKYDPTKTFTQNNANVFSGEDNYVLELREYDKKLPNQNGLVKKKERLYNIHTGDTLGVMFTNISSGYFDFLEARSRSDNFTAIITGEPVTYPTNIEGGYGYFNTHNPTIQVLVAEP